MAYASWSVVFGEQPSAAKWNILGTNDAYFDTYIDRSKFVVQQIETDSAATTTGTTVLPTDNTIPQITEGFEVMTQGITPTTTGNILVVETFVSLGASSGTTSLAAAIFQDSTTNALAAGGVYQATSAGDTQIIVRVKVAAASTSSTTFRVRIGCENGAKTVTFGNSRWGGIPHSSIKVTEYKV